MPNNITQGEIFTCVPSGTKGTLYLDGAAVYSLQLNYARKIARTFRDRSIIGEKNAYLRQRIMRSGPQFKSWAEVGTQLDAYVVVPSEDGEAIYAILVSRGAGHHVKTVIDERYLKMKEHIFTRILAPPYLRGYAVTGAEGSTFYTVRSQAVRPFKFKYSYDDGAGGVTFRRNGEEAEWAAIKLRLLEARVPSAENEAEIAEVFRRLQVAPALLQGRAP